MRTKPVVTEHLYTTHTSFEVAFEFLYNITFISGDSGEGKSAVFTFIRELQAEDKRIRCFDCRNKNEGYKTSIRKSSGKLFVIDNADILLDDRTRAYIATDEKNQYVIIGRDPSGLMLLQDNIWELAHERVGERTKFFLKHTF